MIEKIQIVKQRYDEVSDLIIQPDIIADQKRYAQLSKEYKDLGDVVKIGKEYQSLLNNIEEAKDLLHNTQVACLEELENIIKEKNSEKTADEE